MDRASIWMVARWEAGLGKRVKRRRDEEVQYVVAE